jgi:chemosensory pili system protein ChpA (sensor histidine kinase/response regulator)
MSTASAAAEVVLKDPGPQVYHVRGVSGATVMGNGDVVLIINPVMLAQAQLGESFEGRTLASRSGGPAVRR